jgi:hypothetical protein
LPSETIKRIHRIHTSGSGGVEGQEGSSICQIDIERSFAMNGHDPTSPDTFGATSGSAGDGWPAVGAMPPQAPGELPGAGAAGPDSRSMARRLLSRKRNVWIGVAVLVVAAAGTSIGVAASGSSDTTNTAASSSSSAPLGHGAPFGGAGTGGGGGGNARSGPAAGGSAGTVASVSGSGFTLTTATGQTVTVDETSSTTYQSGSSAASASAVTTGEPVLVLGTVNSTTITAAQVTIEPAGNPYTATSTAVVPFQRGTTGASKQVGQIPASYTEGQGTILSGTTAYQAAQAALAAYPGAVVDRVVQLSDGEYEVHYIGAGWPHSIFVNQSFQVVGAE